MPLTKRRSRSALKRRNSNARLGPGARRLRRYLKCTESGSRADGACQRHYSNLSLLGWPLRSRSRVAKGRMVSCRIATDARLGALSCSTARLLYVTMITQGDALGRLRGASAFVRQAMLPNEVDVTDHDVAGWLEEMVGQKLIDWYEVDGEQYIQLLGWSTYGSLCQQRLDRAKHSDFPDPDQPPDPE